MEIAAIFAHTPDLGIGFKNDLPWPHNQEDMKRFVRITKQYRNLLMGRKTYESLPNKKLKERKIFVLTHDPDFAAEDVIVFHSIEECLAFAESNPLIIAGGATLYEQFAQYIRTLYVTEIHRHYRCDVYVRAGFLNEYQEYERDSYPATDSNPAFSFVRYVAIQD
jgi:dihydrofolate reductase